MKLYVTRHGQTDWNRQRKVLGRTDIPLDSVGLAQAELLAQKLTNSNIDLIISSPLKRAHQTAEAVAKATGLALLTDDRLIEQDYGTFEGVDRDDPGFWAAKECFVCRYPGGESMFQTAHRVYGFLDGLKDRREETVLLVTHGGICRIIHSYFYDMTNEEYPRMMVENCALLEYDL